MLRFPDAPPVAGIALVMFAASGPAFAQQPASSIPASAPALGRAALPAEIRAWNIDIRPDGAGLPAGKGSVAQGEKIFVKKCSSCHGEFGEGNRNGPALAGGQGTLRSNRPARTVGSYWPYLSTLFDYNYRAMPFGNAQSLKPDEVYAVTAFLLNLNEIVGDDFVLSRETFASIGMPNRKNFTGDDRTVSEKAFWKKEPCMKNCKASVKIMGRARLSGITPDAGRKAGGSPR